MTLHNNGTFPLQDELFRGYFGGKESLILKFFPMNNAIIKSLNSATY